MLRVMSDASLTTRDADWSAGFVVDLRLCRPFLAAATTGAHVRLVWDGSVLANVTHYQ